MTFKIMHMQQAARLRAEMDTAQEEAGQQPAEFRMPYLAGIYRHVAEAALQLADELLTAAAGQAPVGGPIGGIGTLCGVPVGGGAFCALQPGHEGGHPTTEVQPPRADATVDVTRPYCFAVYRTDTMPSKRLSSGNHLTPPPGVKDAHAAAVFHAMRVRRERPYLDAPLVVRLWNGEAHYREEPPADAFEMAFGYERRQTT